MKWFRCSSAELRRMSSGSWVECLRCGYQILFSVGVEFYGTGLCSLPHHAIKRTETSQLRLETWELVTLRRFDDFSSKFRILFWSNIVKHGIRRIECICCNSVSARIRDYSGEEIEENTCIYFENGLGDAVKRRILVLFVTYELRCILLFCFFFFLFFFPPTDYNLKLRFYYHVYCVCTYSPCKRSHFWGSQLGDYCCSSLASVTLRDAFIKAILRIVNNHMKIR